MNTQLSLPINGPTSTQPAPDLAVETVDTPFEPKGFVVHSRWLSRILTYLIVLGPGLIVMTADNDAGAVSTYTQAGAKYGLGLMWILLLLLPCTYFIQEMVVRLGIATGQGHAAMIYKRFGKWWGRFSLGDLLLVNFLTLVTEFAAIALATAQLGINPYIGVPVAAVGLIALVTSGRYLRWERITIGLCLFDLTWFALAIGLHGFGTAEVQATVIPSLPAGGLTGDLMFLIIAIVGTTIAPWQLFFQQSAIADKKLRFRHLKFSRIDTFVGACITIGAAGSMMLVGAFATSKGITYDDPAQMAVSLGSFVGPVSRNLILLLMINAAVLGTTAISLASSWAYGEVMGWPHSLQKKVREAPGFYGMYIGGVALAAAIVLIPNAPLQLIILSVQVLAGVMLPSAIIFLQLLLNDRDLLGEYANRWWNNVINWTIIAVLFALSLILAVQVLLPNLFPTN
jgi:Mn2+/Fe2+ NRAMP family transporter